MKGWTSHDITNHQRKMREGKEKPKGCNVEVSLPQAKNGYNQQVVAKYFTDMGLPEPFFEYRFHPTRKWRLDLAWPDWKVCLEVQGGIWTQGRHTRGAALLKEWEKLNELAAMGWRCLFCQPDDVCTADLVNQIRRALDV